MNNVGPYSISRVFDAPRELVFKVSSVPEHMAKWLAGPGFKTSVVKGEVKVGSTYHYMQEGPDGMKMWGRQVYQEIIPNEKIVSISSFSDEKGGIGAHPMSPTWPKEMLSTTTFEDAGPGKTKLTITWAPYNSDEAGNSTFDAARAGMDQGFGASFANLEAYLKTLV